MPVAFKEWAVTVRALAEGEQLLTLRKGGIREENRHFEIEHDRFFLYPTFDHQRNDLVKEAHQPELPRALEEGVWSDGEPSPRGFSRDGGIPQPDRVRIRAWAEVAASYLITDPRCVDALSPYYVWNEQYMRERLRWKPRHPLHVILLRTYRIPRPVTVKVKDDYVGCHSWLELQRELPFEGTPVLSDEEFDARRGADRGHRRRGRPGHPGPRPRLRVGLGRSRPLLPRPGEAEAADQLPREQADRVAERHAGDHVEREMRAECDPCQRDHARSRSRRARAARARPTIPATTIAVVTTMWPLGNEAMCAQCPPSTSSA